MLDLRFGANLLHAISSDAQIEVAIDGEVEVGQLYTVTSIVEDQVLHQSCIGSTHIKVFPGDTIVVPGSGHVHARPVTVQVVDVAPHIEGQGIPACLVVYIDGKTIVLWFGLLTTTPVIALPTLSPDIGKGTYTGIVCMGSLLTGSSELLALIP